jgi:hypothetical protein
MTWSARPCACDQQLEFDGAVRHEDLHETDCQRPMVLDVCDLPRRWSVLSRYHQCPLGSRRKRLRQINMRDDRGLRDLSGLPNGLCRRRGPPLMHPRPKWVATTSPVRLCSRKQPAGTERRSMVSWSPSAGYSAHTSDLQLLQPVKVAIADAARSLIEQYGRPRTEKWRLLARSQTITDLLRDRSSLSES